MGTRASRHESVRASGFPHSRERDRDRERDRQRDNDHDGKDVDCNGVDINSDDAKRHLKKVQ